MVALRQLALVRVLEKERLRLFFESIEIYAPSIALDLEEINALFELVLADKVNLVLALSVPPAAQAGITPLFNELLPEIPFEGMSRKDLVIAFDKPLQLSVQNCSVRNQPVRN